MTDIEKELLPCPFCGGKPEVTKHFREDVWNLIHRCKYVGTIHFDWTTVESIYTKWNQRAAAQRQDGPMVPDSEGWWLRKVEVFKDGGGELENLVMADQPIGVKDDGLWQGRCQEPKQEKEKSK